MSFNSFQGDDVVSKLKLDLKRELAVNTDKSNPKKVSIMKI